ncbi:hypothetical protein E1287_25675 [Actinomadura sp. KC06]|uniref:hypothetical protein n=1 Tax=Actinomadura sp. KC06 TaxID=2530369 RepID=UPI001051CD70|nr:hypothetical protein [Actinomadura sp. KC06]TDD31653.1 hypothetical protein E1287_25675 [Actinomadura sp. KC06]
MTEITTAATCDCPADATENVEGVIVTGHLMTCSLGEPRRYVWRDGGDLQLGTLADYARTWERGIYDDCREELSAELRTWDEVYQLTVESLGTDDADWMRYRLVVANEAVLVGIDGRF